MNFYFIHPNHSKSNSELLCVLLQCVVVCVFAAENITTGQVARQRNLEVIRNEACAQAYGFNVIASTLCTSGQGNVGPCGGDSGGPLALNFSGQRVLVRPIYS